MGREEAGEADDDEDERKIGYRECVAIAVLIDRGMSEWLEI